MGPLAEVVFFFRLFVKRQKLILFRNLKEGNLEGFIFVLFISYFSNLIVFIGQRILIFKLLTQLSSLSCFHNHQKRGFAMKTRLTILWLMDEAKWNLSTLKMKASGTLEIGYSLLAQENNLQNRIQIFSPWINQLYSAKSGRNILWLVNVQLEID